MSEQLKQFQTITPVTPVKNYFRHISGHITVSEPEDLGAARQFNEAMAVLLKGCRFQEKRALVKMVNAMRELYLNNEWRVAADVINDYFTYRRTVRAYTHYCKRLAENQKMRLEEQKKQLENEVRKMGVEPEELEVRISELDAAIQAYTARLEGLIPAEFKAAELRAAGL
ncbi:hypothetical protein L7E55_02365 [Pelotomaculum isophthalicicum JI]|uniref:Uncharacterized protein n=1 Tax=Pelotomaculum isophthalicicum JI TaxID=947010 RepID=A0A9X4JSR2_9FIRM|nr:hypothetical protein [Pelotomaculum isophthalicicum]MDF9407209.1 hypothetical protein [Pelotomaculum isophthalicicum JI]